MCGICGFNWGDKDLVRQMTNILTHRGPDQEGFFVDSNISLGHRRLSIIDLSENGKQPIHNEDKTIYITYNGELYNYKSLKEELEHKKHRFYSNTDTEVIIHAYEEYGEDCLKRFNGMFAFCIYDSKKKKLFLARDRLGKKPLYYYFKDGEFIFASELKAILLHDIKKNINYQGINDYLAYFYIPQPDTIFEDIKKILPGHYMVFEKNSLKIGKYWDFDYMEADISKEDCKTKILSLLRDSIKIRLMSDVPLGAFLSGGVDSSAIVALMSELQRPIKTFSIGFPDEGFSELNYAREVANHFGTEHHELVVDPCKVDVLPKIIWQLDEPFADHSCLPVYYLAKLARKYVKVCLSGDGGDELFGGYDRYRYQLLSNYYNKLPKLIGSNTHKILNGRVKDKAKRFSEFSYLPEEQRYSKWFTIFSEKEKEDIYSDFMNKKITNKDSSSVMIKNYKNYNDKLNNLFYIDIKQYIPNDILTKIDKMSMINSLEVRVPLLDYRLVELSAIIPSRFKVNWFNKKCIFKKALKGIIPDKILERKKQGFGIPIESWFKNDLKSYAQDILLSERCVQRNYFKRDYVKDLLEKHSRGEKNYGNHIWELLCFELWNRIYIDGEKVKL